jgi:hypothetical protein
MTGGINQWLVAAFDKSLLDESNVACKIVSFIIYMMLDFSVLIIVVMTAEKLYAVTRPMRCHQLKFNKKRSIIFMFLAFMLSFIINSHYLYTHSIVYFNDSINDQFNDSNNMTTKDAYCTYNKWNEFYLTYWAYIDATAYSFLPFTLLCTFNILIVVFIIRAAKARSKLKQHQELLGSRNASTGKTTSSYALSSNKQKNKVEFTDGVSNFSTSVHYNASKHGVSIQNVRKFQKTNTVEEISVKINLTSKTVKFNYKEQTEHSKNVNKRLTMMMFLINVSFCLFSMPIVGLQIKHQIDFKDNQNKISYLNELNKNSTDGFKDYEQDIQNYFNRFDLLKAVAEILQYMNHSINFFLYCLSGKTFRKETRDFFHSCYSNFINLFKGTD